METLNIYDSSCTLYFKEVQREKEKREFIDKKMKKMNSFGDSSNLYDLSYVARIREIHRDAERLFG